MEGVTSQKKVDWKRIAIKLIYHTLQIKIYFSTMMFSQSVDENILNDLINKVIIIDHSQTVRRITIACVYVISIIL